MRVYMDGVFDLFHAGHVESLERMKEYGNISVVGVMSDADAASYKRVPVIHEKNRVAMVHQCKYVDEVIFPCPLYVTPAFLNEHDIDVVVHGFSDKADLEKQIKFFEQVNLKTIPYSTRDNTTNIIQRIKGNV